MLDEWAAVRRARRLRGYRGAGGMRRISSEVALFVPVLASALRRATLLATAVAGRGFSPSGPRTTYPELTMRSGERWALAAVVVVALVLAAAWTFVWLGPLLPWSHTTRLEAIRRWVEVWL
jgi:energy-coupling factor transporter transmembrane protein EcfT